MQELLQYVLKNCRKVDTLSNNRIEVHVYECKNMICRVVTKKHGQKLLIPIILCSKDIVGNVLYD